MIFAVYHSHSLKRRKCASLYITGYSAEEAVGRKPSLLRSDHHGPEFYRAMWSSLLDCRNTGIFTLARSSGTPFMVIPPGSARRLFRYISRR